MFGGFTNMLSISYFSRKNILNVFIIVEIGHFYIDIVRMKSSKRFALSNPLVNFFAEFKCSTKQLFYLGAPLRRSTVSLQYLRYFKLFRYEAAQDGQQSFDGHFTYRLGQLQLSTIGYANDNLIKENRIPKKPRVGLNLN